MAEPSIPPGLRLHRPRPLRAPGARRTSSPSCAAPRRSGGTPQPRGASGFDDEGYWVVTRHADVLEVSRDQRHLLQPARRPRSSGTRSRSPRRRWGCSGSSCSTSTRRSTPSCAASCPAASRPGRSRNLREALTARAEAIVQTALAPRARGDFVSDVACELPLQAIAELLGHTAGGPAQDLRLVERDDRLRRPGVRRRPADRRRRTGRLRHGHGRGPPWLPARRHRHQAGPRAGGRRRAVLGRVRLLRDPAGRGGQRDHPERDLPRHAGLPGPPRAVGAVPDAAAGDRGGRDRPLGHPGDGVPAHRAGRHDAGRPADQGGPAGRPVLPVGQLRRGRLRPPGAVRHPAQPQPASGLRRHRHALLPRA